MPNWACGFVSVRGKPENIKNFCKLFVFEDEANTGIPKQGKYFARSFVHQSWANFVKDYDLGDTTGVEFNVDFAWSAWSCLIEGYPQKDKKHCITLKSACKKHNVKVSITTEEDAMSFAESIIANKNKVNYKCKERRMTEKINKVYKINENGFFE